MLKGEKLSDKQIKFCQEFVALRCQPQKQSEAARRAGYSEKAAHVAGSRLMKSPLIQGYIAILTGLPEIPKKLPKLPPVRGLPLPEGEEVITPEEAAPASEEVKQDDVRTLPKRVKNFQPIEITKEYIVARLYENVERCMQKIPVMIKDTVTGKWEQETEEVTDKDGNITEVGVWTYQANVAIKALEVLAKTTPGVIIDNIKHLHLIKNMDKQSEAEDVPMEELEAKKQRLEKAMRMK